METISFTVENIDYIIFIGKNKYSNYNLIDASKDTDIWFHTEEGASPHVILQTELPINKIPIQVIKRCACLCKSHSKSKSIKKCSIIYTTINNIIKTGIIGQVISKNTRKIII